MAIDEFGREIPGVAPLSGTSARDFPLHDEKGEKQDGMGNGRNMMTPGVSMGAPYGSRSRSRSRSRSVSVSRERERIMDGSSSDHDR
eukprot:CAMPEP_0184865828 /NCGR_PEP_ID=MMETSP0580-20130426/19249_1 /TAXON_ID=1118495 /ORGANISM="Dactyliosolen fragilissimus" /LENGTH=86 /DNA_ID=CAMNT_0027365167 /DNA_START=197 /DNA_END=454 /DNA_ORIENTATION=+